MRQRMQKGWLCSLFRRRLPLLRSIARYAPCHKLWYQVSNCQTLIVIHLKADLLWEFSLLDHIHLNAFHIWYRNASRKVLNFLTLIVVECLFICFMWESNDCMPHFLCKILLFVFFILEVLNHMLPLNFLLHSLSLKCSIICCRWTSCFTLWLLYPVLLEDSRIMYCSYKIGFCLDLGLRNQLCYCYSIVETLVVQIQKCR